ncbi:MAG: 60S ribosomal export protein NMD3 [Candidatus Methanomethyliaceae archaeon]|nr:60S ribosomal export protein NMD3 [Candidatus Methanomethyliaceae archaeon]MDW7971147.1 NMD3-related protein [Nitrososphaerota archaeon]
MFCAKCGRKEEVLIENLCERCFWENKEIKIPREIGITICPSCFSYLRGKRWVKGRDLETTVIEGCINEIIKLSKVQRDLKIADIKGKIEEYSNEFPIRVELRIELSFGEFSKILESRGIIHYQRCNRCIEASHGKYDAIVQIRGFDEEALSTVNSIIEEFKIMNGRPEISEIKKVANGMDVKFMSVNRARLFTKKISERVKVEIKESAKISGMRGGSIHYTTTISIRRSPIEIGRLICIGDGIFRILKTHGGRIIAENLESGEIKELDYKDIEKSLIIEESSMKEVLLKSFKEGKVELLDVKRGQCFEVPVNSVQKGLKVGEFGILIAFKDREYIIRKIL